jgi:hypothetical protein
MDVNICRDASLQSLPREERSIGWLPQGRLVTEITNRVDGSLQIFQSDDNPINDCQFVATTKMTPS